MSQVTSYTYDEENRMTGVTHPDGSTESYIYAGDGKRRSKSTLDDLINYVWDEENVLQELDGNTGEVKAHYTDTPGYWGGLTSVHTETSTPASSGAQFNTATFGSAGFNQTASEPESESFFYLFDLQASTRFLVDSSGEIAAEYIYRAFGEVIFDSGSIVNPHKFQGEFGPRSDDSNAVEMRNRVYDPETGTWYSPDPIGFEGLDWNLLRFVDNNPVNFVDPSGLSWCCNFLIKTCCAPPPKPKIPPMTFNPKLWNGDRTLRANNCYAYAINYRGVLPAGTPTNKGFLLQPGHISRGKAWYESGGKLNCKDILRYASEDLKVLARAAGLPVKTIPDAKGCCLRDYHRIQLFVRPDTARKRGDFHWYRQDDNGFWSQKAGITPARDTDWSKPGKKINDPRDKKLHRGSFTRKHYCGTLCAPNRLVTRAVKSNQTY